MTRHIHPGHIAFSMGNSGDVRPSQIRRRQRNAGNRFFCTYCGKAQFNYDATLIHQKICPCRDPVVRAALHRKRLWQRRRERVFDFFYDLGYLVLTWVRRAAIAFHIATKPEAIPTRGPEPTYPNRTQRLCDSVSSKYGRPSQ